MRKTLRKWFWAWDFDKEEKWLNAMSAKGLALVAIGFCKYTFEECLPGEYHIRLELLENTPSHIESERYIKFLEETGIEYLGSITRWAYFRKRTDNNEFDLFSDYKSRIKHLNRILFLIGVLTLAEFCIGLSNIFIYFGSGTILNLIVGILILLLGLLLSYGFMRVNWIRRKFKKEQQLFE